MIKPLLLVCSLLACSAVAQNSRFDGIVLNRNGMPLAGASVAVCLQPVTGTVPCTNPAPLCSSASDATCTSPNPVTADSLGNYFGYVKPGKYTLQFYGSGLTTRTQADQILACDPSICYLSASITFTPIADPAVSAGLFWYSSTTTGRLKWSDASAIHIVVGNDTVDTLSNKTIANGTFTSGIAADGSGFKHKRMASCTTAASAGATCNTTVTWTTQFADANYTAVCNLETPNVAGRLIYYGSKSGVSIVVVIEVIGVSAMSGTIDCIAVHD